MRKLEAIDKDVRIALTKIAEQFVEKGGTVKKLPPIGSGTRGYLFKRKGGGMCVVSVPHGLSRNIVSVANANMSKGVTVPKYDKGPVDVYLHENITLALDVLNPAAGSAEFQLQTILRG